MKAKTLLPSVLTVLAVATGTSLTASAADNSFFTVSTNGTTVTVGKSGSYVSGKTFSQSFPDSASVRKVVFDTLDFTFAPDEASALPDGIVLNGGILRVKNSEALGTGPLAINSNGQFIPSDFGALDISNKVVFGSMDAKVVAAGLVNYPVLRSLGVSGDGIRPWLGRSSGDSRISLSLTGADNEPLGGIRFSGALKPFSLDDGTVRIGRSSVSPFFSHIGSAADKSASQYLAIGGNMAIDAAAGADVELGLPLEFASAMKVKSTISQSNASFEDGENGWTLAQLDGAGSKIGVKENGAASSLGISGTTTAGTHYYVMRCLHRLSGNSGISIPDATGDWFVKFAAATRNNYYSYKIEVKVRFTNTSDSTIYYEATLPARSNYHNNFTEFEVGPFNLPAGNYYLQFETTLPEEDGNKWSMLAIDDIRIVCRGAEKPAIAKTGAGRVSLSGVTTTTNASFAANAGVLAFSDSVFDGADATVANGGTLELSSGVSGGSNGLSISVMTGGTLILTDVSSSNLVANGSFEVDAITKNSGFEALTPNGWTLEELTENAGNGSGSGIQSNGCSVSSAQPLTLSGIKTAYLRQRTRLSQTVDVPESGNYQFSFTIARRDWRAGGKTEDATWQDFTLKASVGGHEFGDVSFGKTAFERISRIVSLSAGDNAVFFETCGENAENGVMVFIDAVRLSKVSPLGELDNVAIDMATNSTLLLDINDEAEVVMPSFSVEGAEVVGRQTAIVRAGVTVSGEGNVRAGKLASTVIYMR